YSLAESDEGFMLRSVSSCARAACKSISLVLVACSVDSLRLAEGFPLARLTASRHARRASLPRLPLVACLSRSSSARYISRPGQLLRWPRKTSWGTQVQPL